MQVIYILGGIIILKVGKANEEQINLIFERFYKDSAKRINSVIFVAIDDEENIIGYILIEEKRIPPPLNGTDWFIWNIFTLPELRQQGIAAALLKETIKHAEQANIRQLIGSCTNTPAHLFWLKHKFCFIMYGQKIDNANNPHEHGNYSHMIFYRLNKTEKEIPINQDYQIIKSDIEQLHWIFDEHILNDGLKFFHDKREDIFGLTAIDKDNNILGIITAYAYELGSPLSGVQWFLPYIYVKPGLRQQEIAYNLIKEMIKFAQEADVTQLTCLFLSDEASEFWYKNNFDMCINYIMKMQDGKNPVSAALRIL